MKLINCHRCGSGNFDQTGIPFRTTPLVRIQNSDPGGASCTSFARKLGAFLLPKAFSPWHSAQCSSNKTFPAGIASLSVASGFAFARYFAGAFSSSVYTEAGSVFSGLPCAAHRKHRQEGNAAQNPKRRLIFIRSSPGTTCSPSVHTPPPP